MVSIYEALYKEEISHELIDIKDLNPVTYNEKYKGNLYCTTKHCSAKLSYVSRNGISDHFRTWRESPHIETCLYYFEKKIKKWTHKKKQALIDGDFNRLQILSECRNATHYKYFKH